MRLVDASTTTGRVGCVAKPSISVSSWSSVCSRSPDEACPVRRLPTASISSMYTTEGAALRAAAKSARTRLEPRPP